MEKQRESGGLENKNQQENRKDYTAKSESIPEQFRKKKKNRLLKSRKGKRRFNGAVAAVFMYVFSCKCFRTHVLMCGFVCTLDVRGPA